LSSLCGPTYKEATWLSSTLSRSSAVAATSLYIRATEESVLGDFCEAQSSESPLSCSMPTTSHPRLLGLLPLLPLGSSPRPHLRTDRQIDHELHRY
jgi:hypothetical protein